MDFVDANGTSKWAEFAKIIGTKTRFACRCRYTTILKFLNRNPDAELKDVTRKDKSRSTKVNLTNYLEAASKLKAAREEPTKTDSNVEKFKENKNSNKIKNISKIRLLSDKLGQQFFQYFKYCYNWQFTADRIPRLFSAEDTERTFTMLQLLDFELDLNRFQTNFTHLTVEDQTNLTLALNVEASSQMKDDIRYVKTFGNKFPVNLNTVLAWRAMQIMVVDKSLVKIERPQSGAYAGKFNLFIRRFKQVFYWTALLSKLDLRIVKERMMTKVTRDDLKVTVENEAICSEAEEDELIEVSESVEQNFVLESESDEENAVDFLLSHIKKKSELQTDNGTDQESAFDIPVDDFDFDITIDEPNIKSEHQPTNLDKRKNESPMTSNENKKPKRVAAAKSMPLT